MLEGKNKPMTIEKWDVLKPSLEDSKKATVVLSMYVILCLLGDKAVL